MAHDAVFISADPADQAFVARLQTYLAARGLMTIQSQPGMDLVENLRRVAAMIVVLSPPAVESLAVQLAYVQGSDLRRPVYSIVAAPCKVPMRLRLFTVLHAETPQQEVQTFLQLAATLQDIAYVPPPDITPVVPQPAIRQPFVRTPIFILSVLVVIVTLLGVVLVRRATSPSLTPFAVRHFTPTPTLSMIAGAPQHTIITFYQIPSKASGVSSLALASDASLWFSETDASQLGHITADGAIQEQPSVIPHPTGLQRGPDGHPWFYGNDDSFRGAVQIGHVTSNGTVATLTCTQTQIMDVTPRAMTFDRQGNLWMSVVGGVLRCNPATGAVTVYRAVSATGGDLYLGPLTVAGNGLVWLYAEKNVEYLDPNGTFHVVPTSHPLDNAAFYAITTASDGSVWFLEDNYLGHILPNGEAVDYPAPAQTFALVALAAGNDGNMWFTTDLQLDTIRSDGQITTVQDSNLSQDGTGDFASNLIPTTDGSVWYLLKLEQVIGHYQP